MRTEQGELRFQHAVTVGPLMKRSILADSSLLQLHFKLLVESWEKIQKKHTKSELFHYRNLQPCRTECEMFLADFIHSRYDLYSTLTLCERWRWEDEASHGVGWRGWHWWGQYASVGGRGPGQRAAGPSVCVTAQDRQLHLTTNI